MARPGVATALCLALCVSAASLAAAASTPPLLPTIAHKAGSQRLSVRCLSAAEWARRKLPRTTGATRVGTVVLVNEKTCSILVGYAVSFPHAPRPGTREELEVAGDLFRFLAAAVSVRDVARGQADCRILVSVVPALTVLGAPSRKYAVGFRTRLLVARKKLNIVVRPSRGCSVKLPKTVAG